jgi:hypothetical protein
MSRRALSVPFVVRRCTLDVLPSDKATLIKSFSCLANPWAVTTIRYLFSRALSDPAGTYRFRPPLTDLQRALSVSGQRVLAQPFKSSGTLPPFAASFCITALCSQMFIAAESSVLPL